MRDIRYVLFVIGIVFLVRCAHAGDATPRPRTIIADPAVAKVLSQLPENHIAKLPDAEVVGDFNDIARKYGLDKTGPGVRNYCLKMPWAEDRQRALFCGGNHGVPHGLNDVWEYDLPGNTWILLWAPDDFTRKSWGRWEDAVMKDGVLQSKRGAPVQAAHSWDQLTYDPDLRCLLWLTSWNISGLLPPDVAAEWQRNNRHPVSLWAYSPSQNQWEPLGLDQSPKRAGNASLLCYIPDLEGTIYYGKTDFKTFLWRRETGKWSLIADKPAPDAGVPSEMISCYDSGRKLVIAISTHKEKGGGTHHFDPVRKEWSRAIAWGEEAMPLAQDMNAVMGYDPESRKCILFANQDGSFGFWSYDPGARSWKKLRPQGEMPPDSPRTKYNGYFDAARQVFVLFKNGEREVWVYRPE
ncbi:MAG: hypothetical protein WD060_01755 [Pirellulales bacterium]